MSIFTTRRNAKDVLLELVERKLAVARERIETEWEGSYSYSAWMTKDRKKILEDDLFESLRERLLHHFLNDLGFKESLITGINNLQLKKDGTVK